MAAAAAADGAVVPPLFRWEIQNALIGAVRRQRMTPGSAVEHLRTLETLVQCDSAVWNAPFETGLMLSLTNGVSAYDAAYLELAQRASLRIMTRDKALASAAATLGLLWKP